MYYSAFQEFDAQGNTGVMEIMVGNALSSSYHKRLAYLRGKEVVKLSDYAKETEQPAAS